MRASARAPARATSLAAIPPAGDDQVRAARLLSTRGLEPERSPAGLMTTTSLASACGGSRASRSRSASRIEIARAAAARDRAHGDSQHAEFAPPSGRQELRTRHRPSRKRESRQVSTGSEVAGQPPPTRMRRTPRSLANKAAPCGAIGVERRKHQQVDALHPEGIERRQHERARAACRACSSCRRCRTATRASAWRAAPPCHGRRRARSRATSPAVRQPRGREQQRQPQRRAAVRRSRQASAAATAARRACGQHEPPRRRGSTRHCAKSRSAAHTRPGHSHSYSVAAAANSRRHPAAGSQPRRQRAGEHQRHEHERDHRNRQQIDARGPPATHRRTPRTSAARAPA